MQTFIYRMQNKIGDGCYMARNYRPSDEVEENYEGYEWHSHVIIDAKNKDAILYISSKKAEFYGHEGIGNEVYFRNVRELTDMEYNVLKGLGF